MIRALVAANPDLAHELGAAAAPASGKRWFTKVVERVAAAAVGKQFGVLGPRAAGKTTLHTWLREGVLVSGSRPTVLATTAPAGRAKFPDASLVIKAGRDVPGERATNLRAWEEVVRQSDYLVYVFDANKLLRGDEDHRREVASDCTVVGQLVRTHHGDRERPRIAMLGTHCDLATGYAPTGALFDRFASRVIGLSAVDDGRYYLRQARPNSPRPSVVLGALNTEQSAELVSIRLLKTLLA
jgi:hypothetical protein